MTYMGLCSNNTPCPLIYETPTLYNYKGTFTQVEEATQSFQYYIKYYWTEIMNNSNIKYPQHWSTSIISQQRVRYPSTCARWNWTTGPLSPPRFEALTHHQAGSCTHVVWGWVPRPCSGKWPPLCSWWHNFAKTAASWRGHLTFIGLMLLPILLEAALVVLCTAIRRPRRWYRFWVALSALISREFPQGAAPERVALGHEQSRLVGRSSMPSITTICRGTYQKKNDKIKDKFYFNAIRTSYLLLYIRT